MFSEAGKYSIAPRAAKYSIAPASAILLKILDTSVVAHVPTVNAEQHSLFKY